MPISFKKPSADYVGYDSNIPTGGVLADFFLEMDVQDSIPLDSIIQGCSIDEVTFTADSDYLSISNGKLTAIKNTEGAMGVEPLGNYATLYAESGGSSAGIFVRVYDRPTGIYLSNDIRETFTKPEFLDTCSIEEQEILKYNFDCFKLIKDSGLEIKPGGLFNVYGKVFPKTACQALRLRSNSTPMQDNINKMTFKDSLFGETCWTTVDVSKDAQFFAGNPDFKSSDTYGTFLTTKRGGKGSGKPEIEIQLQIVEYRAEEPKPLDFLVTTLHVQFGNSVGGRIGTIDGGLRITKDASGRSLVKDVYKSIPAAILKKHAKAVVLEMTQSGPSVMKPGISYTYYWEEITKTFCLYEPDLEKERSRYIDTHGYAVAVHPYGKLMTWSDQKEAVDYSLTDAWKEAGKFYGCRIGCTNTSGFRITSHLHFYNSEVSVNKCVNPVRCLKDYHNKWPGLLYTGKDSSGSDTVSYWILPTLEDCRLMSMHGFHNLSQALANRINYLGGDLTNSSNFWTSTLDPKDLSRVRIITWDDYNGAISGYAKKDDKYDFRPFHRF